MELYEFKLLLEDLVSVGIESAVFDPLEEGTRIRAANKDKSVVVFCNSEFILSASTIAIHNVNSVLSRINLFDVTKAKVELVESNDEVVDIRIKQGRRKSVFRCSTPKNVHVPMNIPVDLDITDENCITFDDKYVSYLGTVIASMSKTVSTEVAKIGIYATDTTVCVSIADGDSDSFNDELEIVTEPIDKSVWDAVSFSKVMKQSAKDGECKFIITKDYGLAAFRVGYIDVIVVPAV